MKATVPLATLLPMGVPAQAALTPLDEATVMTASVVVAPPNNAVGAIPEAGYFREPQANSESTFLCRLRLDVFDKTLLSRVCR